MQKGVLTRLSERTFDGCTKLASFIVYDLFDEIENINPSLFRDTAFYANLDNWENNALYLGKTLIDIKSSVGEIYEINQGTKTIAQSAFWMLENLKSVTIPQSVKKIGYNAFGECIGLKHIYYQGTIVQWESISKEENWDYNTGGWMYPLTTKYKIHCIDGDI